MMHPYLARYVSFTALYGAIHAAVHNPSHSTYRRPSGAKTTQPVLLTHHFMNILCNAVVGPGMWPIMVYHDLTRVECALRGKDPDDYYNCIK
jgi:hypothetical protein